VKAPQFEVYRARDGWRWRLKAANGRILASGEAHTRKADAVRAAAALPALAEVAAGSPPEVVPAPVTRKPAKKVAKAKAAGLTPKQTRFVAEYLKDLNASAACKAVR
jgi:uncharacterized protein YegP (UPF0339 family)